MEIAAIDDAIAREDWRAALALALAWWQGTRAPELADLVEALGARLATPPLTSGPAAAFHDRWLVAVVTDPVGNLGPALATVTRALPLGEISDVRRYDELRHKYAPWLARLALLHGIDDPRIASAFTRILRAPPFLDEFHGPDTVYDPLLATLVRLGDVRQATPLRRAGERPTASRSWLRALQAEMLPRTAATIAEQELVPLAEHAAVAALVARLATPAGSVDDADLLDLVHAAPDDDGAREVLADRWLERGDPRGELVALQLKEARGTATPADRKKIASLVRKHDREWLGVLRAVTKNRRWERGFLDEIELMASSVTSMATWIETPRDPALRTVRAIHKGAANEKHFRRLVMAAPNLREVSAVSKGMLAELCATPPSRVEWLAVNAQPEKKDVDTIVASFPRLETLSIPITVANVDRTIARVAALLPRAPGVAFVARCAVRAESDAPVARWLLAVRKELAPLREVMLAVHDRRDSQSIAVSVGARGLRVTVRGTNLSTAELLFPLLGHIEHVTLRAPHGSVIESRRREAYDVLFASIPDVTLDEAWQAFVSA